jgi:hypothetical protein
VGGDLKSVDTYCGRSREKSTSGAPLGVGAGLHRHQGVRACPCCIIVKKTKNIWCANMAAMTISLVPPLREGTTPLLIVTRD